jgi:hypothetical protein
VDLGRGHDKNNRCEGRSIETIPLFWDPLFAHKSTTQDGVPFIAIITSRDADFKGTTVSAALKLIKCDQSLRTKPTGSFLILIFDLRGFQELAPPKIKKTPNTKINIRPPSVALLHK